MESCAVGIGLGQGRKQDPEGVKMDGRSELSRKLQHFQKIF